MIIKKLLCIIVVILSSSVLFALPYYVDPEILDEVKINQARYELNPTSNEVIFDLSMSYAYSGQILKGWNLLKQLPKSYAPVVIDKYSKLQEEDPDNWKYPFKLAFGYFFIKEKETSIALFRRVVEINPKQVWGWGFIALVYGEMGQTNKAIHYCKKALKIEPDATAIHFLLAEAYRKKKQYFKMMKELLIVGKLQAKG